MREREGGGVSVFEKLPNQEDAMKYDGTLTADQLTAVRATADEWLQIGLSTERADRPTVESAVLDAYRTAEIEPPLITIWMDSPLGGCFAAGVISQLGGQLWDELWGQLRDQLWDQLRGQLRGQLGDQLRGQLRGQLWDQLRWSLSWWSDSYWLAIYKHALTAAELPDSPRLDALTAVTREVGWWWPMRGAVVLTDRPTVLQRDQLGRLHGERSAAIEYADGYDLWAWHGTRVPRDLIEVGWDTKTILSEPNAEIRRCAIERVGWDQFALDAKLKVVDEQPDPANGDHRLRLCDVPSKIYGTPVRVLLCVNGSPERDGTVRKFGLTVPAEINDAVHAAAWTYELDADAYRQLERRT